MSARLKRYEIRAKNRTKKDVAKYKAMSSAIADFFRFLASVPEEIKLSYASEILMQMRGDKHKKGSRWQHEHRQTYTLLNQAIGARNNFMNTRAVSKIFTVGDIADILGSVYYRPRAVKLKKSERLGFG